MTIVKVLLVEDHPTWQKILRDDVQDALEQVNYSGEIEIVDSYDAARSCLEKDEWHLLVTDVGLGNPSESLQKLGMRLVKLAHKQQVPAIAVSGTYHLKLHDIRKLFKESGASDFFSKQEFDDTEFIATVQTLLQAIVLLPPVTRILFLSAHSKNTSQAYLSQEVRGITEGLKRAKNREQFILEPHWAVQSEDFRRALLDTNPHIVHLSGYGEELAFEEKEDLAERVHGDALAETFKLFADQVKCVVLNGCFSLEQAGAIAQHIPYVIRVGETAGHRAAIEYAVAFYDALGAGRSIEFAHKLGCHAIELAGLTEFATPQLIHRQPHST